MTSVNYANHDGRELQLPARLRRKLGVDGVKDLYPEYYLLKANDFDRFSKTPLDQWMFFLSTGRIPDNVTAPGLAEARERLRIDSLSSEQRADYYRHLDNVRSLRNVADDARDEGYIEGYDEGIAYGVDMGKELGKELGIMEERRRTAAKLLSMGMSQADVAEITGLDIDEVSLSGQARP